VAQLRVQALLANDQTSGDINDDLSVAAQSGEETHRHTSICSSGSPRVAAPIFAGASTML